MPSLPAKIIVSLTAHSYLSPLDIISSWRRHNRNQSFLLQESRASPLCVTHRPKHRPTLPPHQQLTNARLTVSPPHRRISLASLS